MLPANSSEDFAEARRPPRPLPPAVHQRSGHCGITLLAAVGVAIKSLPLTPATPRMRIGGSALTPVAVVTGST